MGKCDTRAVIKQITPARAVKAGGRKMGNCSKQSNADIARGLKTGDD